MVAKKDFKERLAEAMAFAKTDIKALSAALGISYQAIKKALDGTSKSLKADNNSAAARLLRVNPDWLATGDGTMLDASPPAKKPMALDDALDVLGTALTHTDPTIREALATSLAGWAREGGKKHWRGMVSQLLTETEPGKRAA